MALLFDFFPVLLFFLAYKWYGIFVATAVIIAATLVQVAVQWVRSRTVKPMHLVTAVLVLVFGGITLLLGDEEWIKWKVTAVNWFLAVAFLVTPLIGDRRTAIERLIGNELKLPAEVWKRLNLMWVAFFLVLGAVNLVVMYRFDTDTWVDFKVWGVIGLTLLFVLIQGAYLMRHVEQDSKEQ
ncbi:MAG TPA: septation protein A [Gammaproteobacteria bacterium]|nr:septation protein A [Gammaproteobacteria bacterium]